MKKRIISLIIVLLLLVGCSKEEQKETKEELSYKIDNNIKIEINSEEKYNTDYIHDIENGELITEKELIDTTKLGEQELIIKVQDKIEDEEKEIKITINIVDTTPPEIEYKDKLETTNGTKIDLLKNVKVTDNSKETIKATVEGDYNFNKEGTYNLKYVAKDSSNNETKKDFTLTVKAKPAPAPTPQPNPNNNTNNTNTFRTEGSSPSLAGPTSNGHTVTVTNGIAYVDGYLIANKTYALPESYAPGMNATVTAKANEMFAAAKQAGYNMWNQSGFRSYATQKSLYTGYVNRSGKAQADTYSARPGNSEHQTGLAFDVCATGKACINSGFDSTPEAKWLSENAYKYGFILRYPKGKQGETGYMYESWHFRYVGVELATILYNGGNWITMESYFGITSQYDY
ncbi:MAG: D-alanyl-D-alanine carboxypeptidase family protein [Bacilli bacterium]|nr:D-alanyl-D-alanine carboxypeptidase family protein [Bacilli bacterium]